MDNTDRLIDALTEALSNVVGEKVEHFVVMMETKGSFKTLINANPLAQHCLLSRLNVEIVKLELMRQGVLKGD